MMSYLINSIPHCNAQSHYLAMSLRDSFATWEEKVCGESVNYDIAKHNIINLKIFRTIGNLLSSTLFNINK
jgi:hypothetical protein